MHQLISSYFKYGRTHDLTQRKKTSVLRLQVTRPDSEVYETI